MVVYLLALLIGVVAGLRTMTAPAAVSWAAYVGWLALYKTPLGFLGATVSPYIFTALAIGELVGDKLPKTPSRRVPIQFGARLVSGGLSGAAVGAPGGGLMIGLFAGVIGAVIATLGGSEARAWLAKAMGKDLPAALLEDLVALGGAALIVTALSRL